MTGAQLRQQGFMTANQLANQAYGQNMGLGQGFMGAGQQAMQQAQQNQGLFGTAAQLQSGLGQQAAGCSTSRHW